MKEIIVANNLVKTFKSKERKGLFKSNIKIIKALDKVSFKIYQGEIFSLVGPNGAGKTTTIKILSTLLIPDEGEAFVNGFDVLKQPNKVRESIGLILAPDKGFYVRLTGIENLVYYGRLYGLSKSEALKRAEKLVEIVNLGKDAYRTVDEYSLGMKAKLSIAKALIHDPPILFLDEPTVGLDPLSARRIRMLITELAKEGKTILLTSHNMWEVETLSDRVAVINKGNIVAIGSSIELKEKLGLKYIIEVEILNNEVKEYETTLGERGNPVIKITTDKPSEKLMSLIEELKEKKYNLGYIRIIEPSMEEVFAKIVEEK
ncbi:MAG: ABC transporter ATP-binding protein [Thermoproteota archaeon]|jgi:ABC-2 type transport system ATP-binding protein